MVVQVPNGENWVPVMKLYGIQAAMQSCPSVESVIAEWCSMITIRHAKSRSYSVLSQRQKGGITGVSHSSIACGSSAPSSSSSSSSLSPSSS